MNDFSDILLGDPLPGSFYSHSTLPLAKALLGKYLCRRWRDSLLVGKIVETEAYIGEDDPACHAARGKTNRNAIMYGPPGFVYIYFILKGFKQSIRRQN